jgi:hypothetical protein
MKKRAFKWPLGLDRFSAPLLPNTLYQHADDSEGSGAAALARTADTARLRRADPADMGAREPVWAVRP